MGIWEGDEGCIIISFCEVAVKGEFQQEGKKIMALRPDPHPFLTWCSQALGF
jgi:hypothetical protein